MAKKSWRILFEGRVQGVGFRLTARQKARALGVRGWVRNRRDGSVEIEAEAEEEALEEFLRSLQEHFSGFISNCDVQAAAYEGKFSSFEIRF